MVDPGEKISATLKREFGEEALNSLQKSPEEKAELEKQLQRLFSQEHFVVSCVSLWKPLSAVGNLQLLRNWGSVAVIKISCDTQFPVV